MLICMCVKEGNAKNHCVEISTKSLSYEIKVIILYSLSSFLL